jgi:cholesterol transport system auxiliary component
MSGRVHAWNALVLAAALALAGCVTLLPKADPVTLYRFGAAPVEATAAAEAGVRIGIVRAPTLFQRESAGDQLLSVSGE